MTSLRDSSHGPWYLQQAGLIYGVPRHAESYNTEYDNIKYHANKSRSESDLKVSSRWTSISPPPTKILGVSGDSPDDCWEEFKQLNGGQRIPSPDPIHSTYSVSIAPDLGGRTEATPSGVEEFCENCLGMNAENLAQPGGYKHSMLSELFESWEWCKLCQVLKSWSRLGRMADFTPDRYQISVSLEETGDDVELRPDLTHCPRPRSPMRHDNNRTPFCDKFSQLWIKVIDQRPWEAPEIYIDEEDSLFPWKSLSPNLKGISVSWLACLTEEHDPATEFGIGYIRQIGSDTSSTRSMEIAAGWLTSCLTAETPAKLIDWKPPYYNPEPYPGHEAGASRTIAAQGDAVSLPSQDPLRLVEIQAGTRGSAPQIRLIHTGGRHCSYAALSYCWGKAQAGDSRPWQTTHATLKSNLGGIRRQDLPQTLQDVIFICESLDISYLWVDSLCIIQDSPSDWAAESAKMSGIYLGSLLTISLSASVSAESGCFNIASQRTIETEKVFSWETIDTRMRDGRFSRLYLAACVSPPGSFKDEVRRGALANRAWALQELILPQRTLYITSKQLLWECGHCRLSEDNFPQDHTDRLYPICDYVCPLDATAIVETWYKRVVEDYTRRQLTFEKDKLVAISALARATYLNRHIGYVAGLWRDAIIPGLLWARKGEGCKSKTYSCPTWSWASQNSAVTYLFATPLRSTPRSSEPFPRVQGVFWDTKPENPFGDVLFAYVDLETTIALGTVLRDSAFGGVGYVWEVGSNIQTLIIPWPGQKGALCEGAVMDDADGGGRNVVVASMGHCLLLLEPPSLSSKEYRRVGVVIGSYSWLSGMDKLSHGWTQRTFRLV